MAYSAAACNFEPHLAAFFERSFCRPLTTGQPAREVARQQLSMMKGTYYPSLNQSESSGALQAVGVRIWFSTGAKTHREGFPIALTLLPSRQSFYIFLATLVL